MLVTYEQVKDQMDKYGYVATEELVWNALRLLNKFSATNETQKGQDISAICLEGPPGAGKTEFAKVMLKLVNDLIGDNCSMIEYQCDPTTGKTELFEDINITAAVSGDADKVVLDGALLKAIGELNKGKRCILFIDEYDKAREETDAFFLQFLQSGAISTSQREDARIKPEYKKNLHVILCKNDNREHLSGPLERRLQFIRLSEMTPDVFFKVANKKFPDNSEIVNFVTLVYEIMYKSKSDFSRICSCSEMLIAIEDAINYEKWGAPAHVIYKAIFNNMVKNKDDEPIFYKKLQSAKDKLGVDLATLLNKKKEEAPSIEKLLKDNFYGDLKKQYDEKVAQLERLKEKVLSGNDITFKKGQYSYEEIDNPLFYIENNFDEDKEYLRGENVFSGGENWSKVATIKFGKTFDRKTYLQQMFNLFKDKENFADGKIYENGFRSNYANGELKFNFVKLNKNKEHSLEVYSNSPIVPLEIMNDLGLVLMGLDNLKGEKKIDINCIVYNNKKLDLETVAHNLYRIDLKNGDFDDFASLAQTTLANVGQWSMSDLKVNQEQTM